MAPSPRAQVRSWLRPGEGRTGTVPGILRGGLQEQGCHLDGRWEAKWFAQEGPGSGGLKGEGTVWMATKDAGEEASGLGSKPGPGAALALPPEWTWRAQRTPNALASGCDSLQRAAHTFPKRFPVSSPCWEELGGSGVGINMATAVGKEKFSQNLKAARIITWKSWFPESRPLDSHPEHPPPMAPSLPPSIHGLRSLDSSLFSASSVHSPPSPLQHISPQDGDTGHTSQEAVLASSFSLSGLALASALALSLPPLPYQEDWSEM